MPLPSNKLKILFLGANPKNTTRLRIDEELREIDQQLRLSSARERLSLAQAAAVRANDLQQALIDNEPQIVHFSGHGAEEGIALEDDEGNARLVSSEAVSDLFGLFKDSVQCVVLNACYSEMQAKAIRKHIPFVIGMHEQMPDEAAIKFSIGFYKAIAAGKTVRFAFNLGVNAIKLEGIDATLVPVLLSDDKDFSLLSEVAPLAQATENNAEASKKVMQRWLGGGLAAVAVAGLIGFMIARNLPENELAYRIGDAKVDLYKNSTDSLLMTFELICDNNSSKNLKFYRDSVTLFFEDWDKRFSSFHDGSPVLNINKKENKTVTVQFVTPMRFKPLSIYIAQRHGTARVDYGFGNLATLTPPVSALEVLPAPSLDTSIMPVVVATDPDKKQPSPGKRVPTKTVVVAQHKEVPKATNSDTVAVTAGNMTVSPAAISALRQRILYPTVLPQKEVVPNIIIKNKDAIRVPPARILQPKKRIQ